MKKLLTLFAALVLVAISIAAHEIPEDEARAIAMQKFAAMGKTVSKSKVRRVQGVSEGDVQPLYIYNNAGGGFVIVSGDDAVQNIVLAYGAESEFNPDDCSPATKEWLEDMTNMIKAIQAGDIEAPHRSPALDFSSPVGPLIQTKWGQNLPYCMYCPVVEWTDNKRYYCVSGCVATALAQVMKYWEWPKERNLNISPYTWTYNKVPGKPVQKELSIRQGKIKEDSDEEYPTTFDWVKMQDVYNFDRNNITAADNAVALLMSDCGIALKMNYGLNSTGGSGAYTGDAWNILLNMYGYNENARYLVADYMPRDEWTAMVKAELDATPKPRPVLYCGKNSSGGHAFFCDGYDSTGKFHINWGWNGVSDGYFELDVLNPEEQGVGGTSNGYAISQGALFGLQSPKCTDEVVPVRDVAWDFVYETATVTPSSDKTTFTITINDIWNEGGGTYPAGGSFYVCVTNLSNKEKTRMLQWTSPNELPFNYHLANQKTSSLSCADFAAGVYEISFETDVSDGNGGQTTYIIPNNIRKNKPRFVIENGKISLSQTKNVYQIANAAQLKAFAQLMNSTEGYAEQDAQAKITANINMENVEFEGIGTEVLPFKGVIDGNGKTITFAWNSENDNVGLVSHADGCTINNLTIAGQLESTHEQGYASAFIANAHGSSTTTLTNCHNKAVVSSAFASGLVGKGANVLIEKCSNSGDVRASIAAAGLVTHATGNDAMVMVVKSVNKGNVLSTTATRAASTSAAAICALVDEGTALSISSCYNTGEAQDFTASNSTTAISSSYDSNLNKIYDAGNESDFNSNNIANGELAWALNGNKAMENPVWRQNLTGSNPDPEPVFDVTHDIVIKATTKGLNSICRPTTGKIRGVQVYEFTGIRDSYVWGIPVNADANGDTELVAAYPYMFDVSDTDDDGIAYVNFSPTAGAAASKVTECENAHMMHGVLSEAGKQVKGSDYIVFTATGLKYANANKGNTVTYGKCYIEAGAVTSTSIGHASAMRIGVIDGAATSIEEVDSTVGDDMQFAVNLQGMRVDENYKGIVIINGKKVLRK